MELAHHIKKQSSNFRRSELGRQGAEVDAFRETVHNYQNDGVTVRFWKVGNEVEGEILLDS